MPGIFLKISGLRYIKGIINKKGIKGTLYLTMAPVTVVVIPIRRNEVKIIVTQQTSKL
jgi:hypothetical protein